MKIIIFLHQITEICSNRKYKWQNYLKISLRKARKKSQKQSLLQLYKIAT